MIADEIGPVEMSEDDFTQRWEELTELAEHIFRKGFDEGKVLGTAAHEVRGIACHLLDEHRLLVLAGDKLGFWYAGTFDPQTGEPADLPWHKLPSIHEEDTEFVIDILRIIIWQGEPAVVIGTRGGGARIAPLREVCRRDWHGEGLVFLPGGEGRAIRRILFDPVAKTLWAAAGTDLLVWSLKTERPRLVGEERLGFRVTALTIDECDEDSARDHLYVATNLCGLHRFERAADGSFHVTAGDLDPEKAFWRGRASVLEWLEPLSAVRYLDRVTGRWLRRYQDRGVFGATLRHLVLVCDDPGKGSTAFSQTRIVSLHSKILDLTTVCFPSWQCLAVATLEGQVRIFRPSGVRNPEQEFAPYAENVPEIASPSALLSGFEDASFPERVYGFALPGISSAGGPNFPIVLGLGNHRVRLYQFTVRWDLRRRAWEVARDLAESLPPQDLLERLQKIALSPDQRRQEKNGIIQILPEVGLRCTTQEHWQQLRLLVWDVLAHLEDHALAIYMIQALRRLQALYPERREDLEETITTIRKYILDQRSFSEKETDFLKLVHSTDPSLEDDRMIYRSILCSRRYDPVFNRDFGSSDQFGEVQAFAAVPQQARDGSMAPFDSVPPEEMRFLVGTYRCTVWLLDGTGRALRLEGNDQAWGYVQAIHFRQGEAILAFSQQGMLRLSLSALLGRWETLLEEPRVIFHPLQANVPSARALSFCRAPGKSEADERFLWGDGEGRIFLGDVVNPIPLASLQGDPVGRGVHSEIQALSSFTATAPDGTEVDLVVACTSTGSLHLLLWEGGLEPSLTPLEVVQIGVTAATSLLVSDSAPRQVIVAGMDGTVAGYWVLLRREPSGRLSASLALYWAYRAEQAVRALQPLYPVSQEEPRSPYEPLIVAGSYDEHLHVLDLFGRHLEIVYLPKTKVDRFVTGRTFEEDSTYAETRVYACAFENHFRGLRVVSRRRLLQDIDKKLRDVSEDQREEHLSRWRAFSLQEGHLRHRFARQSQRYPGPGARDALEEIRRFLESGDSSDRPTGIVTALLRRLFQNRLPGQLKTDDERPAGLREILNDPELYLETVRLLRQLEEQWNTPGSIENRRVQLLWIRSFLRNIESLEMLRRWAAVGFKRANVDPLAAPDELLYHFLDSSTELLQLKSLQYVERLLFGWPGVSGRGILWRERVSASDLDWLLDPLLRWLWTHKNLIDRHRPHAVVLQIGRLFGLLIRGGYLDPMYLSYRLQDREIPGEMDEILIGQCAAMGCLRIDGEDTPDGEVSSRMVSASWVLAQERLLEKQLERRDHMDAIVETMEKILAYIEEVEEGEVSSHFLAEVGCYFRTLIPLLQVKNLDDLKDLKQRWQPSAEPSKYFKSYKHLLELSLVLEQVRHYHERKHADIHLDPLCCLQYEDFHRVRVAWRMVRDSYEEKRGTFDQQEKRLFFRLLGQWDQIISEEQNKYLLQDLLQIVEDRLKEVPKTSINAVEANARVEEEEGLTFKAFSNLFTRLLLFSQPTRALFIYRGLENQTVGHRVFVQREDPSDYLLIEGGNSDPAPFTIPSAWKSWDAFSQLESYRILDWLKEDEPALDWRIVPIPIVSEAVPHFGFYVFGWKEEARPGLERFEFHRLTWVVVLQALAFRQASISQDAIKGRIFSIVAHNLGAPVFKMRSDLAVLVKGFLEDQPERRRDKYRELLRQARHMTGIIDGILSLSARDTSVQLTQVSLASLIYEVVRIVRKDAAGKRINLSFPRPDYDAEQASIVWTDEVKVYDILLNLIGNAIKYSPPGSRVEIGLQLQRKGIEVRVRDEGPGIPKHEQGLIFEPFFRGASSLAQNIPGMGLGLYVAQLYARKLEGRIQVTNNAEGRGAVFTIYLPHLSGADEAIGEVK